jgi:aspartyl-tRNA(Asn)/glutamyl-tRNA(Gln) amidotransferase subunit C
MPSPITEHELRHLAELARLKLEPREEEKLLRDLQNILDHFEELKEVDTANVSPMRGGTLLRNVFRDDEENAQQNSGAGKASFPETKDDYLKVPPIFER